VAVVAAIGVVLASVAGAWFYEEKWPPTIEDRELARIGSPILGTRPLGHAYNVEGSVFCIDVCLTRGRAYAATGTLGTLVEQASGHLRAKGYAELGKLSCLQTEPRPLDANPYDLQCSLGGRRGKFTGTVVFEFHSPAPFEPVNAPIVGYQSLPLAPLDATGNPASVAVEVGY
jgi:hypothetical protein